MPGLGMLAAFLLGIGLLASACEPPAPFVDVGGHPGKRGVDGGVDAGNPPPPGPVPSLTVTVEGHGRVFSRFFDCSSTCTAEVPAGQAFEVHAEGNPGFAMVGWTGACAGATGCRIELAGDAGLGVTFAPRIP